MLANSRRSIIATAPPGWRYGFSASCPALHEAARRLVAQKAFCLSSQVVRGRGLSSLSDLTF
jgi:hypothetical protein